MNSHSVTAADEVIAIRSGSSNGNPSDAHHDMSDNSTTLTALTTMTVQPPSHASNDEVFVISHTLNPDVIVLSEDAPKRKRSHDGEIVPMNANLPSTSARTPQYVVPPATPVKTPKIESKTKPGRFSRADLRPPVVAHTARTNFQAIPRARKSVHTSLVDESLGYRLAKKHESAPFTPELIHETNQEGLASRGMLDVSKLFDKVNEAEKKGDSEAVTQYSWMATIAIKLNCASNDAGEARDMNMSRTGSPKTSVADKGVKGFGTHPAPSTKFMLSAGSFGPGCDLSAVYELLQKKEKFAVLNTEILLTAFYRAFVNEIVFLGYHETTRHCVTSRFRKLNNGMVDLDHRTVIDFMDSVTRVHGQPMWPLGDKYAEKEARKEHIEAMQYFLDGNRRALKKQFLIYADENGIPLTDKVLNDLVDDSGEDRTDWPSSSNSPN